MYNTQLRVRDIINTSYPPRGVLAKDSSTDVLVKATPKGATVSKAMKTD